MTEKDVESSEPIPDFNILDYGVPVGNLIKRARLQQRLNEHLFQTFAERDPEEIVTQINEGRKMNRIAEQKINWLSQFPESMTLEEAINKIKGEK